MPTRSAQLERTRGAILASARELLLGFQDPSEFTMQAVADRAGVSHRTLYRHFATRHDLIDAVGDSMDADANARALVEGVAVDVDDFDAWVSGIGAVLRFGAVNRELMRRVLLLGIATSGWRRDRDARYWGLFRERFPNLDEDTARQDFAALRHLLSAFSVVSMGERFDLSPDELTPALQRAAGALIEDVERRDRSAAQEGRG